MELKIQGNGKTKVLRALGTLTIEDAEAFRNALLSCIEGGEEVEFYIDGIEDADLACLELMCSAHKTAEESRIKMLVYGSVSEGLWNAINEAGFFSRTTCRWNDTCIWDEIKEGDDR